MKYEVYACSCDVVDVQHAAAQHVIWLTCAKEAGVLLSAEPFVLDTVCLSFVALQLVILCQQLARHSCFNCSVKAKCLPPLVADS